MKLHILFVSALLASEVFAAPVIIVRPPVMVARPYVAPARPAPAPAAKPIEKQVTPTPMPMIVAPIHTNNCNEDKRKEKRC